MHQAGTSAGAANVQTILLAEDDDLSRKFLVAFLTSLGYEVSIAVTGTDAEEKCAREPVGLLVTDFQLPGMDGISLLRSLRAKRRKLPVILISGYLSESVEQEALEAGVDAILRKPLELAALRDKVTALYPRVDP